MSILSEHLLDSAELEIDNLRADKALVESENQRLTAENGELREAADHRQNVIINMTREANELKAENNELKAILACIDKKAPRADKNCYEPGITLSEATRNYLKEIGAI